MIPCQCNQFGDELLSASERQLLEQKLKLEGRKLPEQDDAPWGLDLVDQRDLPLDHAYHYTNKGRRARMLANAGRWVMC
jgi:hypothetical protein